MTPVNRFSYRAAHADGALVEGVLTADSRDAAARKLAAQGLWTVELAPARLSTRGSARVSIADLALGLRVLATLLEAGLPIGTALAEMPELAPASWAGTLPDLQSAVREGVSLGTALERSGPAMPGVVLGIVLAGEAGSGLGQAVRRAAELLEEMAATRSAVGGALAYPLLLAVAGTISVVILVAVVLPRFGAILTDMGQTLPPATRLVLEASAIARAGALPAGLASLIVLTVWQAWVRTPRGAVRWHQVMLGLPIVGAVRRAAATGRVCGALAALLESGVPLSLALGHAARASGNPAIAERVAAARACVVAGSRLSAAFQTECAVTPVAARLVRAGEETGALASMLSHASRLEGERATRRVKDAVRLLEPALILAFGGLVALVAAALLQAIYSVRPS